MSPEPRVYDNIFEMLLGLHAGGGTVPDRASSGLIYEGARRVVERDRVGLGVMIFPDDLFKYTSNLVQHLPSLAEGTQP
jgi:hypothetical protein